MEIAGFKGEIRLNEPLSRHTSYRIGGPADVLAYPADRDDLVALLGVIREKGMRYFILGGGTNLLVRDGGFRGAAIKLERMNAVRIKREYHSVGGAYAHVYVEAGAALARLVSFAVDEGLTGLEFAAGIPGTVGGAILMNAGTSEGEIGDIVDSVTMLSPEGVFITAGREQLGFGYRSSGVPEGHPVIDAVLVLRREEKALIRERIKKLMEKRMERQPQGAPNAGSVFKNPLDESAGRLIESSGLKGMRVGDARVSEKHANFILNVGKATASDVLALMDIVREKVLETHKIRLDPEIKIIGED